LGAVNFIGSEPTGKGVLPEADEWFALALKENPDADEAPGLLTGKKGRHWLTQSQPHESNLTASTPL
jgi:hypothetical protein